MTIDYRLEDNIGILSITGDLALDVEQKIISNELNKAWNKLIKSIETKDVYGVIFNLEGVSGITSLGMGWLIRVYTHLQKQQIDLVFCNMSDDITDLLASAQLDRVCPFYQTEEEALASFH